MIGDLKYRVTIQEAARATDGAGGFTETWQNIALNPVVFAGIEALSGGEQLRFHQLESGVTHRIMIRSRSDITPRHRLQKGGDIYNIVSVLPLKTAPGYMEILASQKMP